MNNSILLQYLMRAEFSKIKKVLDLGCNFPKDLYRIQLQLNPKLLVGVDSMKEIDAVSTSDENEEEPEIESDESVAVYKRYVRYMTPIAGSKLLEFEEFQKTFDFYYEQELTDFVSKQDCKGFDLLILKQILHFYPSDGQRISKMEELLNNFDSGCVVFISVWGPHPGFSRDCENPVHPFNFEEFNELCSSLIPIHGPVKTMIERGFLKCPKTYCDLYEFFGRIK